MNRDEGSVLDENAADNLLLTALARDDPAAVGLLWERYAKDLLAYLQAILCSPHDAEDMLQVVFVRIVRKRRQLAKAHCLDAYIYRIARNEALRLIGRRRVEKAAKAGGEPWLIGSESSGESEELVERLQVALARLPQAQREVIVMKVYRQKTFSEISRLLGLSQNTVASRYRYGMEKLRTLLEDLV
jgi:RNA polymerase sigma-70 factor (ECF subfamily)